MTTTESNSLTKNEILGDLMAHDGGDTITFTGGRNTVTVKCGNTCYSIDGIPGTFDGEKRTAATIAAMIRG